MAKLNISQAARATNKSRSTIQRDIKNGKLSVSKSAAGMTEVDTAELMRIYGELASNGATMQHASDVAENDMMTQLATSAIEALQRELEAAREREREAIKREEWLREQLKAEQGRSKEFERRLLPPPEAATQPKKSWLPWRKKGN